jgi:hypothetical protein
VKVRVPDQLQVPFTSNLELVKKINGPSTVVPADIVVKPDIALVTVPSVFLIPVLEKVMAEKKQLEKSIDCAEVPLNIVVAEEEYELPPTTEKLPLNVWLLAPVETAVLLVIKNAPLTVHEVLKTTLSALERVKLLKVIPKLYGAVLPID